MTNYRYLGYGVTDSNGVAKLDHNANGDPLTHSYTGVGAGEIDVVASLDNPVESGSIVSETLSVLDTLLYDTGTDATHNIWTGDTSNLTRGSEYSRLEESTIGSMVQLNATMPNGLWVLTMTVKKDGNNGDWNINILNNNVSVFGCGTPANDVWTDITFVYDGSFISYFVNGSTTPTKKTSVMLDESKTTVLRLQTPQNITYIDFKDLIVLREGMSNISIGSSTPIIQSGSNATINGTLYESGLPVKNATLDVYKNGTKVGTASTGSTGVASYSYTGVADGEVEFQFRYGSILSETYTVYDCIWYDDGVTDPKTVTWYNYNSLVGVSISNNGTSLTPSQTYVGYYAKNGALLSYPFAVEFTVVDYTESPQLRLSPQTGSTQYGILNCTHNGVYKVLVQESGITALLDGESTEIYTNTWNHEDMKAQFYFDFIGDRITFKDFKIYPI